MVIAVPIMRGLAKYSDIKTLELYDFVRMNEILLVQAENEKRSNDEAERKSRSK